MARSTKKPRLRLTPYNKLILRMARVTPCPSALARHLRRTRMNKRATSNNVSMQLAKLVRMGLLKGRYGRGMPRLRRRAAHELAPRRLAFRAFTVDEMLTQLKRVS